jgi:hypothetical protein
VHSDAEQHQRYFTSSKQSTQGSLQTGSRLESSSCAREYRQSDQSRSIKGPAHVRTGSAECTPIERGAILDP